MKLYIGDSVYVDFDGFYLILTTENGYGPTNKIYLDPQVHANLLDYVKSLNERSATNNDKTSLD